MESHGRQNPRGRIPDQHKDIYDMACAYPPSNDSAQTDNFVDELAPRIGSAGDEISMRDLSKINLVKVFDQFSAELCSEVMGSRTMPDDRENGAAPISGETTRKQGLTLAPR